MDELNKDALVEIPKLILIEDLGYLYPKEDSKKKARYGIYKCGFCGTEFRANTHHILRGAIKSCGCYQKRRASETNKTHGLRSTKLYRIWWNIKSRTLNPKNKDYCKYGGRGITICDEWKNDFLSFYNWAINNGWIMGLTIDRIDNDGNYEPSNCQWITMRENTLKDKIKFNLTNKEKEYVCKMYEVELKTVTEIATIFKTHKKNISDILTKNNITIAKGNSKRCIVKQ